MNRSDSGPDAEYDPIAEGDWAPPSAIPTEAAAFSAGVGQEATAGVVWLTAQRWVIRLLGFVTIAVLTRLLSPQDFGTVAAASAVLPFFYLLADLGFAAYIVQVEKADQRMLSTAFWFSMGAGVVLCAILVAIAPLVGAAFHDEGVTPVVQALSLWVVLTAIGSVPMAILRRNMRFRVIAVQGAIAAGIAQVVAMVMAFAGMGVWALVVQSLVAPSVTTVLAWITSRWRPSMSFSISEFRTMAVFGSRVLGVEFVAMLRALGEAAVISATLGIAALGYMNIAQRLVQVVQDMTGSAIVPVTQVAFAKIRDTPERLRGAYLRAIRMAYATLSLPLTILAITAPLVIPIIFGSGWEESYSVAQILALAGVLTVGAALDHGLFYSLGRPGTWFVYALIIDGLTLGTTVVMARFGLVEIAWGFLGVCLVATVSRWFLTARLLRTRPWVVAGPFGYLVVAVTLSGAAGWGAMALTSALHPLVATVLIALVIAVVHLGLTQLIAPRVIPEMLSLVARSKRGARIPFIRNFSGREL